METLQDITSQRKDLEKGIERLNAEVKEIPTEKEDLKNRIKGFEENEKQEIETELKIKHK